MKNAANGFSIQSQMTCKLKVGDTFEANEILALDERWFKYNFNDKGASMCIGTLCNIAILVNYDENYTLREGGCLADIAPTLLEMMGMAQPAEMTGKSLLIKK